jgi:uncharacterized protein (DUF433 family)
MPSAFPSIVCTEDTLWGSPRIDGRRLAVGDVVSTLKYGGLHEALTDFELSRSEVIQALQYCSTLQCKADRPKIFCHNCSLSGEANPLDISDLEEVRGKNTVQVRGPNFIFFGSMEDLLDDWNGQDWWEIATDLLIDLRVELFGSQDQK